MRNTPKNLNEEIMKMRKLMNFNISENSHNVLSENVINESVITENQLKSLHVEQEKRVDYWKKRIPEILVAPFNKKVWSLI